jgi:hypothetical protein
VEAQFLVNLALHHSPLSERAKFYPN